MTGSDNPFTPRPLGSGWTPPGDTNASTETEQDDPFAEDLQPEQESPANGDTLGSLFTDGIPVSKTEVTADASLGALFGDVDSAAGGGDQADATTSAPNTGPVDDTSAPLVRSRPRRKTLVLPGAGAEVSGGNPLDTRVDLEKRLDVMPDVTPKQDVATPVDRVAADATRGSERRFPLPQVPEPAPVVTQLPTSYLAVFSRGDKEVEQLWRIVDQTLGLVSTDSSLQKLAAELQLTPDARVHQEQSRALHASLRTKMAQAGITVPGRVEPVLDLISDEILGISVLGEYYRDPDVNEILVDRWDVVSIERLGRLESTPVRFRDAQHAESAARGLALKVSDRAVGRSIPLVTAELPSARVTFAFGSVVKGGLSITMRKFRALLALDELLAYGTLNEEMVSFLSDAVRARASILVAGGTGTGKTTIINLLSTFIPDSERVVTIEDAFELKLANSHVVSLQTKEASSLDDSVSVTLADLLRNTLRMRPDRIIVGEIREGEGAMVMLTAANTGHDGTITTIHANTPDSALNERLPDLVRQQRSSADDGAVLRSVAGAFDLVIQVVKSRSGRRYLADISAVGTVDPVTRRITLDPVFQGHETGAGTEFRRFVLRADTELAARMAEAGVTTWTN